MAFWEGAIHMKKALIVWGGWEGHEPKKVAAVFERILKEEGFSVELSDTLEVFGDEPKLMDLNLIVPVWTMGSIAQEKIEPVFKAVQSGVGLAGCHAGMCDALRGVTRWMFMTGGQWVSHPGDDGVRYRVNITSVKDPITEGIGDFEVTSEQYYMLVDPANRVLATTRFPVADGPHVPNGPVDMPVVWTKMYGKGRVFYHSLGHRAEILVQEPCQTITRRGLLWAAK